MSKSILVIDTPKSCEALEYRLNCIGGEIDDVAMKLGVEIPLPISTFKELTERHKYLVKKYEFYNKLHKALGSATVPTEQRQVNDNER
jgi:hypothetical protein